MTGKKHIKKDDKNPKTVAEPQVKHKVNRMNKAELTQLKQHLENNNQHDSLRYRQVMAKLCVKTATQTTSIDPVWTVAKNK